MYVDMHVCVCACACACVCVCVCVCECVCVCVLATSRAASSSCWLIFPSLSVSYLTKRFKTFDLERKRKKTS